MAGSACSFKDRFMPFEAVALECSFMRKREAGTLQRHLLQQCERPDFLLCDGKPRDALERLCVSPQCGFASCEIGNKLTEEDQWAKLRLVQEIAKEVWGE